MREADAMPESTSRAGGAASGTRDTASQASIPSERAAEPAANGIPVAAEPQPKPRLLDQVRHKLRLVDYSIRTEDADVD